mmetsp:Transcript_4819/g.11965  ORF Transcript_4819/g.11965 Transcript_4819/m.11965 type:complete len:234 (+) Transcript_4819:569-1270(+)
MARGRGAFARILPPLQVHRPVLLLPAAPSRDPRARHVDLESAGRHEDGLVVLVLRRAAAVRAAPALHGARRDGQARARGARTGVLRRRGHQLLRAHVLQLGLRDADHRGRRQGGDRLGAEPLARLQCARAVLRGQRQQQLRARLPALRDPRAEGAPPVRGAPHRLEHVRAASEPKVRLVPPCCCSVLGQPLSASLPCPWCRMPRVCLWRVGWGRVIACVYCLSARGSRGRERK